MDSFNNEHSTNSSSSGDRQTKTWRKPCLRCPCMAGFFDGLCSNCYICEVKKRKAESEITSSAKVDDWVQHMQRLKNNSTPPVVAKKNRCECCNKRVGLLGFRCRCGGTFCGKHRYAESHTCSFDFKAAGKVVIMKQNPLVQADKLRDRV